MAISLKDQYTTLPVLHEKPEGIFFRKLQAKLQTRLLEVLKTHTHTQVLSLTTL